MKEVTECCNLFFICVMAAALSIGSAADRYTTTCEWPENIVNISYWRYHDYSRGRMLFQKYSEENEQKIRQDNYLSASRGSIRPISANKSVCMAMIDKYRPVEYYLMSPTSDSTAFECVRIFPPTGPHYKAMTYSSVRTVLFSCGFEKDGFTETLCDMDNLAGLNPWLVETFAAGTRDTGPKEAYLNTHFYLYLPDHKPEYANKVISIRTPLLDYSGRVCVRFAYHLSGPSTDKLILRAHSSDNLDNRILWERHGNTSLTDWIMEFVNVTNSPRAFVFEGHTSVSYTHDIAIDEITITSEPCPTVRMRCEFGIEGICGLEHARSAAQWKLRSGEAPDYSSTGSSTGPPYGLGQSSSYLIMLGYPDLVENTVRIQTWVYEVGVVCVRFAYYMSGRHINQLGLYAKSHLGERFLWRRSGDVGQKWHIVQRRVVTDAGVTNIGVEGVLGTGRYDDIAIDDFLVFYGECEPAVQTVLTCPKKEFDGNIVEILVRWWDINADPFNFGFKMSCPFTKGRYHVIVNQTRECKSDRYSHADMADGIIELHTCKAGSSYEKPFRNIKLHCFGELPVSSIGSEEQFGRVLVLAINELGNDADYRAKFYVGRFEVNNKEIQISIQGNKNGRFQPENRWGPDKNYASQNEFATSFHMLPYGCSKVGCDNNGRCEEYFPDDPNFKCICTTGHTGRFCEKIFNCGESKCEEHGFCRRLAADRETCDCHAGYIGIDCSIDVDECNQVQCNNQGTCFEKSDVVTCECALGYTGKFCERDLNDCSNQPCSNGATCLDLVDGYACTCRAGYVGVQCQTDINECNAEQCNNHGHCAENGVDCDCSEGYTGEYCETDIVECDSSPCQNRATCEDIVNGYTCNCHEGYVGLLCQTNTKDCISRPCQNGATCKDLISGFWCYCTVGWGGRRCEEVFLPCESSPCHNGGTCEAYRSGFVETYFCTCRNGTTGLQCQTDTIDECISRPCRNGGTCKQNVYGYKCSCIMGYIGKLCQTDIDECSETHCKDQGRCSDFENGVKCECFADNTGENCETDINECSDTHCNGKGRCSDFENGVKCDCDTGFTGDSCENEIGTLAVTIEGYTGPVTEGESLSLTCRIDAQAKVTYMWLRTNQSNSSPVAISGNITYRISQITVSDEGQYTCVVDTGSESAQASVEVEVLASGEAQALKAKASENGGLITGLVVALLIMVVVLIVVIVAWFYHRKAMQVKVDAEGERLEHEVETARSNLEEVSPVE